MAISLQDVRRLVEPGEKQKFEVMKAFITGFEAPNEFPTKFWHRGCTVPKVDGKGFPCSRQVEGPWGCANIHKSLAIGTWAPMFRFDVYASAHILAASSPPVRLTVFDVAATLLGKSPDAFLELDEFSQFCHVYAKTQGLQMVSLYISYNPKDKFPIVQGLSFDDDCHIISSRPGPRTPRTPTWWGNPVGTPGAFLTPASSSGDSTSSSRDRTIETAQKDKKIKKLLFELVDAFGRTKVNNY